MSLQGNSSPPPEMLQARRHGLTRIGTATLWPLAVTVASLALPAVAQDFKTNDVNVQSRRLARIVKDCVNQPATYNAEKQQFNDYFQQYYFPVMTQVTPEDLGELGKRRYDFFRQYLWPAQSAEMQRDLTNMTREYMQGLLKDPRYHPSVRYNAILMLGMLDVEYASDRGGGNTPKPMPEMTQLLVNVLGAIGKSAQVTPDLVVGALVGLERHAQYSAGLPPANVDSIETAMLRLIAMNKPLANQDADVNAWIKRQAAGVLAQLGRPGQNGRVIKGLISLIQNPQMPLIERCHVVAQLSRLSLQGTDTEEVGKALILLAHQVGQHHAEQAREYEDLHVVGGGGRSSGSNYRRTSSSYGETVKYERRRLLSQLEQLAAALTKVEAVAEGETKTHLADVLAAINSVRVMAKDDKSLDLDLTAQVKRMARDIERVADLYDATEEPAAATASEAADAPR